ncbi:UNVERIFIED_CONTAM: class I heat shock protein [Sesamum radiatum]|uniref:Class I heat shock protein n=1 Tax=Sesamum radiatum TaxID=300843 RepID=A0AAW2LDS5_SESRA
MSLMPIFRINKPRRHHHVYDHPLTRDICNPFDEFHHMDHRHAASFHNITKFEWKETPEAHVLRAELPGFKKEEVKVEVEEGKVLKISGKKEVEKEEKRENWQYFEHSEGKFLRAFTLAENVKHDEVRCSWENGVLTVAVPKKGC